MSEEKRVGEEVTLARYATSSSHLRQDNTPRPELFMPHPYSDLSVTSHSGLTEQEIWHIGERVTKQIGPDKKLHGRADVVCSKYLKEKLRVVFDPLPENQNHCLVLDWPREKSAQKSIAQQIVSVASCLRPATQ